jgi:isochorismate synthase
MNIDQLTCYSNYALYRLPEHDSCTLLAQTQGEPQVVEAVSQLAGRKGFVMAPFEPTASHPILLMQPDVVETMAVEGEAADEAGVDPATDDADGREAYHRGFERFHAELATGRVGKLVLSRSVRNRCGRLGRATPSSQHADPLIPPIYRTGVYAALRHMAHATPEVLLDGTAALAHQGPGGGGAGTMRDGWGGTGNGRGKWSEKNKAEQQFVSRYIEEILCGWPPT